MVGRHSTETPGISLVSWPPSSLRILTDWSELIFGVLTLLNYRFDETFRFILANYAL